MPTLQAQLRLHAFVCGQPIRLNDRQRPSQAGAFDVRPSLGETGSARRQRPVLIANCTEMKENYSDEYDAIRKVNRHACRQWL